MDNRKGRQEELISFFPIGVKYGQYRDIQEDKWAEDFPNMHECGINAIRVNAFWSVIEPKEGVFNFGEYDRIVDKASEYGIKVLFTIYHMSAPEWIYKKHPDSRYVSINGTVWNSSQHTDNSHGGWPGLCFDSRPFRKTVEKFVKAFTEHYRGNKNILAFDVWHEPSEEAGTHGAERNWRDVMFCKCSHSVNGFREWLKRKYRNLGGLNRAWTRHYNSWDEVEPPYNLGIYTDWLDWKRYRIDALSDAVHWMGSLVKKYDPDRATTVHSGIIEFGHPVTHSDDRFKLADATDMFACSMYDAIHPEIAGLTGDLMRSASKGAYWNGETGTGAGPIFSLLGSRPDEYHAFSTSLRPEQIFRLVWGDIARGCKGTFFWSWRPELGSMETLSLGFTERNGALTKRTEALSAYASVVQKYRRELAEARTPESDVAIFMNMNSMLMEGIASIGSAGSGYVDLKGRHYKDMLSLFGCYKLCMKNGIQPDFINEEQIRAGIPQHYRILFLPYSISIDAKTADALKNYVNNGGNIVSDALLGFFGDTGWGSEICPPEGLDKVFGVTAKDDYLPVTTCGMQMNGELFTDAGCFICEHLSVSENAQTLAYFENGDSACIKNTFGNGNAIYIGTMFFANAERSGLSTTNSFFLKILENIGYHSDKTISGIEETDIVEVRKLHGNGNEFIFILNHTENTQQLRINTSVSVGGKYCNILNEQELYPVNEMKLELHIELNPYEVKILLGRQE